MVNPGSLFYKHRRRCVLAALCQFRFFGFLVLNKKTFIYSIRCLLLPTFRSLAAIVSEKSTVFSFSHRKAYVTEGLGSQTGLFSPVFCPKVKHNLPSYQSCFFYYLNTYVFQMYTKIGTKRNEGVCFGIKYMGI